jgi:hypothetical protein
VRSAILLRSGSKGTILRLVKTRTEGIINAFSRQSNRPSGERGTGNCIGETSPGNQIFGDFDICALGENYTVHNSRYSNDYVSIVSDKDVMAHISFR